MAVKASCGTLALGLLVLCHFPVGFAARRPQQCWSTFRIRRTASAISRSCFEGQCRCDDTIVDCSFSNITYVPKVSSSVTFLNLSNNNIKDIVGSQFFVNASRNVSGLDLYNNGLTKITLGTFRFMRNLKRLFMGGNQLTYDQVVHVLHAPSLKSLELKCGYLGDIPQNFFTNRSCPHLRYVDMSWNKMKVLDMEVFQPLRRLETLILRYNQMKAVTSAHHPYLKVWILHKNKLFKFPTTCGTDGSSLYPNLTVLDLDFNYISDLSNAVCLPSLIRLSLSFNMLEVFYKNMFSLPRFPLLKKLALVQMRAKIQEMEEYAFNNSNIITIELGWNNIDFSSVSISTDVFQGCGHVEKVFLDNTNFADVDHERFQSLLQPLSSSLKVLYLGKTDLTLRSDTFDNLTHLRELYLYGNELRSVPEGAFDHLVNLTVLKLSNNVLTTVPSSTFSEETKQRLKKIDLSGNPFSCNCEIVALQQWMLSQPRQFVDFRRQGYHCANVPKTSVWAFHIPQQACLWDPSTSKLVSGSIILAIIFLLAVMAVWKWRWRLHHWLYEWRRRDVVHAADERPFSFHVFVAYDEDDSHWVRHTLLPVLQDEWGLKVCIHERDFDPGRTDLGNIGQYLPGCHSIVAVFSTSFARDNWRQFELNLCQEQAVRTSRPLVVILLPGWSHGITGSMQAVLRNPDWPSLRWKEGPEVNRFWRSLRQFLEDAIHTAEEERRQNANGMQQQIL